MAELLKTYLSDPKALANQLKKAFGPVYRDIAKGLAKVFHSWGDVGRGLKALTSDYGTIADALKNGAGTSFRNVAKAFDGLAAPDWGDAPR